MSISQVEFDTVLDGVEVSLATIVPVDVSSPANIASRSTEADICGRLRQVIQSVEDSIAPVWPLKDYVAVNPFLGLSDRPFLKARESLRAVSDSETLMPLEYFQAKFRRGEFEYDDVQLAVTDITSAKRATHLPLHDVLAALCDNMASADGMGHDKACSGGAERYVYTIAETADKFSHANWAEVVREEIGQHLAAFYDEGQAVWQNPWKHLPLFQAWRSSAKQDRRLDAMGLHFFCRFVDSLPHTPEATIAFALNQLRVPEDLWEPFLLCQAHSIPGWSAWTKYRTNNAKCAHAEDFVGLLAIRLAYDAALSKHTGFEIGWTSLAKSWKAPGRPIQVSADKDALIRFALLRATERAYERTLIDSLNQHGGGDQTNDAQQPLAQMVFCIDVRSERYRRSLETISSEVQTFGFAGFFGVPIAYQAMGEQSASPQVPALLSPQFTIKETIRGASEKAAATAIERRGFRRSLRKMWKQFQTSAVGCFGFVETTGLGFGWKLLSKSVRPQAVSARFDGVATSSQSKLGPDIRQLEQLGLSGDQQADMAESILRGIGIVDNFAKLIVFCGHGSTVQNNPLQAGLDCGACCGHSGEPNARFAVMLLNQPAVRVGLKARGVSVPDETKFVAAVHDTTSDCVSWFDTDLLSAEQLESLSELQRETTEATGLCQLERMPHLNAKNVSDVLKRTADWSEVRPEWGLAGNAAFIVAPRTVTENADLNGRSFLHSYDFRNDPEFKVLEQIMTAPMVVAHWINMQYYASSVDNQHCGSGSKTIHNVVGKFGIFSGNGGDLTTGLPWQSIHNGAEFQHEPLRLLSVIAAPCDAVADIIQRNKVVEDLVVNDWLNLVVLDDGQWYRFTSQQTWEMLNHEVSFTRDEVCQMA